MKPTTASHSWKCVLDSCHMPSFTSKRLKMSGGNVPLNHSQTQRKASLKCERISLRE